MSTFLPPDRTKGVFAISSHAIIDAPRERVWSVLTDFSSYPEWNPFVRSQVVTDSKKQPLEDPTPEVGRHLLMSVHIPPTMDDGRAKTNSSFEIITAVDRENFRLAWKFLGVPSFLLSAERWQWLTTEGEGGESRTRYETIEVFNGILAYVVKWMMEKGLKEGFEAMAQTLKARSEENPSSA